MNNVILSLSPQRVFLFFSVILLASISLFTFYESLLFLLIPMAAIGTVIFLVDTKKIFYLFFFLLPFSVEIHTPGGLGTDLPSEPLMLLFTGIAILLFLSHARTAKSRTFTHPITTILLLHLAWTGYSALLSEAPIVSFKFLLAKLWYVIPFYFLFTFWFRSKKDYLIMIRLLIVSITISIIYVMMGHAQSSFSFDTINKAVGPIFRNHVNYGCLLSLFLPYIFLYKKWTGRSKILYVIIILFLIAIFLSYTRAAMLAAILAGISYYIIKFRLLHICILASILVGIVGLSTYMNNNKFLDLAPNYERTIAHHNFDNLIEATYKMEDISTMERLHRWVAASQMIKAHPITGFGPGCFYFFYKSYAINSFKTYVSGNPEKSGIHNYYLMIWVEQGIIGFLIFIALCIMTLLYGQSLYHRLPLGYKKELVMASTCSFIIILSILFINDMVETDKVGPFFFISMSTLVTCSFPEKGTD